MPATTITMPATRGATTHASPSRPRYGPSVPTFVVGFRPGGRNWKRFRATRRSIAGTSVTLGDVDVGSDDDRAAVHDQFGARHVRGLVAR
jgi:hypothetical protein